MSSECDPLTYPFLFPHGEPGWHSNMIGTFLIWVFLFLIFYSYSKGELTEDQQQRAQRRQSGTARRKITMLQFYAYKMSARPEFNVILYAGKLFQQYMVDAFVKVNILYKTLIFILYFYFKFVRARATP